MRFCDLQACLSRPSRTFGLKMRWAAQVHQNQFSWLKRRRIDPSGGVPGALGEIVKSINFEPPGRGQNPRKGLLKVTLGYMIVCLSRPSRTSRLAPHFALILPCLSYVTFFEAFGPQGLFKPTCSRLLALKACLSQPVRGFWPSRPV